MIPDTYLTVLIWLCLVIVAAMFVFKVGRKP